MATPKPVDGMSHDEFTAWIRGEIRTIGAEYRKAFTDAGVLAKEIAEIAPRDPDQGNLFVLRAAGVAKAESHEQPSGPPKSYPCVSRRRASSQTQ